jgi:C4-dicarboxylate-specific signal transduction histidine kinase
METDVIEATKARKRERERARYQANKGAIKAKNAAWKRANRDRANQLQRDYNERNREQVNARQRDWYSRNKEKAALFESKRRAAKLCASSFIQSELTEFATVEAAHLSVLRQVATGINWEIDHMLPLQAQDVCGLHVWNNLQVIPRLLNRRKRNRLVFTNPGEWIAAL